VKETYSKIDPKVQLDLLLTQDGEDDIALRELIHSKFYHL